MEEIVHPWFGPAAVRYSVEPLPSDPDGQTERTIVRMAELARADSGDPIVRQVAGSLQRGDPQSSAEAVFWYVRDRLRFVPDSRTAQPLAGIDLDPVGAEVLIRPVDILRMPAGSGDCDDFAMLVASLLLALGIPCAFVTVAADPEAPRRYSHVYVVAEVVPDGWLSLDASHGSYPGWEAENLGRRREWRLRMIPAAADPLELPDWLVSLGDLVVDAQGNEVPVYSTTATTKAPQWWETLLNRGLDVVQSRYGLPENSYEQKEGGTIEIRGNPTVPTAASSVASAVSSAAKSAGSALTGTNGTILLIGGAVMLLVLLTQKK